MEQYYDLDGMSKEDAKKFLPKSQVFHGDRKIKDRNFGIALAGLLTVQFILSLVLIGAATSAEDILDEYSDMVNKLQCNDMTSSLALLIISDSASEINSGVDLGVLLENNIGVFVGFVLLSFAVSSSWVYFLRKFARNTVWFSILLKGAVLIVIGFYFLASEYGSALAGISCFAYTAIVWALAYRLRDKIETSAEILREACVAFSETDYMLHWSLVLQVFLLGFSALNAVSLLYGIRVGSVVINNAPGSEFGLCDWSEAGWVEPARYFNLAMLLWGLLQIEAVRLFMVSFSVGCWYFPHETNPPLVVKTGLQHAITKSFGTLAIGSVIMALVEVLERAARKPRTPIGCFLWVIVKIFQSVINFLTKFALIVSALAGTSFSGSIPIASGLLKRHFVGGYVTDRVGVNVLEGFAMMMSIAMGLSAGLIIDVGDGYKPLNRGLFADDLLGQAHIGGIILLALSLSFIKYKLLGLIVFLMFPWIFVLFFGEGMTLGLFIGILASYLFYFMANVLLDHVSAVFVCYAIDRDNGCLSPHTAKIDKVVKGLENYTEMPDIESNGEAVGVEAIPVATSPLVETSAQAQPPPYATPLA